MDRLALVLIGLVFGAGIGFVVAASAGVTLDGHDHWARGADGVAGSHAGGANDHETPLFLQAGADVPTIDVALIPDPVSGWNLHVATENFSFAPERAGYAHVAGEGHAHVYVDGEKIARLYGPWMHIASLPKGATVEVTLNANDHRPLAVGSTRVAASTRILAE